MKTTNEERAINNTANAAVAGMVGAAIGAAVGGAATVILTDKKKRTQVAGAIKDIRKRAGTAADSLKSQKKTLQGAVENTADKAAKVLEDGEESSKRSKRMSV